MKKLTKKEILDNAGYVPVKGRPSISDEDTATISVRLPVSVIKKIPGNKSEWVRGLIIEKTRKGI